MPHLGFFWSWLPCVVVLILDSTLLKAIAQQSPNTLWFSSRLLVVSERNTQLCGKQPGTHGFYHALRHLAAIIGSLLTRPRSMKHFEVRKVIHRFAVFVIL